MLSTHSRHVLWSPNGRPASVLARCLHRSAVGIGLVLRRTGIWLRHWCLSLWLSTYRRINRIDDLVSLIRSSRLHEWLVSDRIPILMCVQPFLAIYQKV